MRDTLFIASGMAPAVLVFAALVTVGCAQDGPPSGESNGDGREVTKARSDAGREPTVTRGERGILTGVITDEGSSCLVQQRPCSRILVEEDHDAGCGGPPAPGCEKTYFDVTRETSVFRRMGDTLDAAPVGDLRKGLRVSVDSGGYPVMESYPSQTCARAVEILGSP